MMNENQLTSIAYNAVAHQDDVIRRLQSEISKLSNEKKLLEEENHKLTDALWRMKRKLKGIKNGKEL